MPYLIFDLEMSGTEVGYHDIIQIGAVLANDNWDQIATFESLVYPDNEETFNQKAEEIHGISIFDLEEAPSSYDVLENFETWVRKYLRRSKTDKLTDVIICGQSVINDINFLKQKYDELNLNWPFSFKLVDLLSMSVLVFRVLENNNFEKPKSYSLKNVALHFGINREDVQHNALEDSLITFQCFKKYFEIMDKVKLVG
jgi:DNA polymerase III subunit epsilon